MRNNDPNSKSVRSAAPQLPSPHVHPDERERVAALTVLTSPPAPPAPDYSYYTPLLIQCTLPHSDPGTLVWLKKSGTITLIVASGYNTQGKAYGIPYGSFPRRGTATIAALLGHKVCQGAFVRKNDDFPLAENPSQYPPGLYLEKPPCKGWLKCLVFGQYATSWVRFD